jgi:hypothetical protein
MLKRLIFMVVVLGSLAFSQQTLALELELVKEIKIKEGIYGICGTYPEVSGKTVEETTFPVRAVSTDKGIILFDKKGDILRKIPKKKRSSLKRTLLFSNTSSISKR